MTTYTVKHHSGRSVFEWRVYVTHKNGARIQLGKYRTKEKAEAHLAIARAHYEKVFGKKEA